MRWKIIELEVIEFVIKIVLQRIFDFHLKFLSRKANYFITLLPRRRLHIEWCLLKVLRNVSNEFVNLICDGSAMIRSRKYLENSDASCLIHLTIFRWKFEIILKLSVFYCDGLFALSAMFSSRSRKKYVTRNQFPLEVKLFNKIGEKRKKRFWNGFSKVLRRFSFTSSSSCWNLSGKIRSIVRRWQV